MKLAAAGLVLSAMRLTARRAALMLCLAAFVSPATHAQNVVVFAAASLRDAMEAIATAYRGSTRGKVAASYAGSSALAKQIENGAPADIFVSADLDWMDHLEKKGLLAPGTRANLLRNELVLIAPAGSRVQTDIKPGFPLESLLGSGRLAMADPDAVPAGKYGKASLQALGVWPSVAGKVARADNVRGALVFVARGEAPLGIVYRSDAAAERNVRIVGMFPAGTHAPIVYPVALLKGARSEARPFYAFLRSAAAADIFRKHGFVPY